MGLRGPAPTPTKILDARGSWRAGLNKNEVQFEPGVPTCPEFLSAEAKREWTRQTKQLDAAGILQKTDRAALATYCQTWGEYVELNEYLAKLTIAERVESIKQLTARRQTALLLMKLGGLFGFSPSDRTRIHAGAPVEEADPLEELLSAKRPA